MSTKKKVKTAKKVKKAFDLFYKKDFVKALSEFSKAIEEDSTEGWEKNRLSQYVEICNTQIEAGSSELSADTLPVSMGSVSVLINEKLYDQATTMLDKMDLPSGTKLFLQAEMAVEQSQFEVASEFLKQAIDESPLNKGYALNSPSFNEHLAEECFEFLRA